VACEWTQCSQGKRRKPTLTPLWIPRLIRPIVGEESDKCGIIAESGEDVAWDEAWELR
jgi:hypothetical protein